MAKDDFQVIVFRILKYLYLQLKKGLPVEAEMLRHDSKICKVNEPIGGTSSRACRTRG